MYKLFTSEDLIRFAYHEMTDSESEELKAELLECEHLQQELHEILETKDLMDEVVESAPVTLVKSLLNYSASLHVLRSSSGGGSFGVVLN